VDEEAIAKLKEEEKALNDELVWRSCSG